MPVTDLREVPQTQRRYTRPLLLDDETKVRAANRLSQALGSTARWSLGDSCYYSIVAMRAACQA